MQLELGGSYRVELESNNPHDASAVAVFDGPRKVGNLRRDCGKAVRAIMVENKAKSNYYML